MPDHIFDGSNLVEYRQGPGDPKAPDGLTASMYGYSHVDTVVEGSERVTIYRKTGQPIRPSAQVGSAATNRERLAYTPEVPPRPDYAPRRRIGGGMWGVIIGVSALLLAAVIATIVLTVNHRAEVRALEEQTAAEEQRRAFYTGAVEDCGLGPSSQGITISDGGLTLSIHADTLGLDGVSFFDFECISEGIDMPDYISDQVDSTRALDGTREAEWGPHRASWTYHPDSGLRFTVTQM